MKKSAFAVVSILMTIVSMWQGWNVYSGLFNIITASIIVSVFEITRLVLLYKIVSKRTIVTVAMYIVIALSCSAAAINSFILEARAAERKNNDAYIVTLSEYDAISSREKSRLIAILSQKKTVVIDSELDAIRQCRLFASRNGNDEYYAKRIDDHNATISEIRKEISSFQALSVEEAAALSGEELSNEYTSCRKPDKTMTAFSQISEFWGIDVDTIIIIIAIVLTVIVEISIVTSGLLSSSRRDDDVTLVTSRCVTHDFNNVTTYDDNMTTRDDHDNNVTGDSSRITHDDDDDDYIRFCEIVEKNRGVVPPSSAVTMSLRKARAEYIRRNS